MYKTSEILKQRVCDISVNNIKHCSWAICYTSSTSCQGLVKCINGPDADLFRPLQFHHDSHGDDDGDDLQLGS